MRRVALAATLLLLSAAAARGEDQAVNLFISPPGEPFTAPVGDPYPIVLWFNRADTNHDGKLDIDEFRADADRFFAVLDRNKDGVISQREVSYYEHYLVPEILSPNASLSGGIIRVALQGGDIDPGGGGGDEPEKPRQRLDTTQGAVQFSLLREPEPVRAADRNFDYRITLQEFREHSDRHFKLLDVNGDGFITLDELPQTLAEKFAKARRR